MRIVKGLKALSESISKVIVAFSALEIILLALKNLLIKRAVYSFIKDFKYLTAANK